jgi:hypothetical protein
MLPDLDHEWTLVYQRYVLCFTRSLEDIKAIMSRKDIKAYQMVLKYKGKFRFLRLLFYDIWRDWMATATRLRDRMSIEPHPDPAASIHPRTIKNHPSLIGTVYGGRGISKKWHSTPSAKILHAHYFTWQTGPFDHNNHDGRPPSTPPQRYPTHQ